MYIEGISHATKLNNYIFGINPNLSVEVGVAKPKNIHAAIQHAKGYSQKYKTDVTSFQPKIVGNYHPK